MKKETVTRPTKKETDVDSAFTKSNKLISLRGSYPFRSLPSSLTKFPGTRVPCFSTTPLFDPALDELLRNLRSSRKNLMKEESLDEVILSESTASLETTISSVSSTTSLLSRRASLSTQIFKSKNNVGFEFQSRDEESKGSLTLERPKKRRRFQRRNSFIVRDFAQLAKIASQSDVGAGTGTQSL
ncbi:unnamed protein product [Pseudo-nitzschia multistriata]|uniref:Uncharacterized protein n=1 Tax=Pseudo-nitzschia multistriata TaxID=183589 RepID=A0A448Z391_9STRA|nr:unnamed protein product [Pseudo-nitzschia multistriata]